MTFHPHAVAQRDLSALDQAPLASTVRQVCQMRSKGGYGPSAAHEQRIRLQMWRARKAFRQAKKAIAARTPSVYQGMQRQEGAKDTVIREQHFLWWAKTLVYEAKPVTPCAEIAPYIAASYAKDRVGADCIPIPLGGRCVAKEYNTKSTLLPERNLPAHEWRDAPIG
jgi:hypothetical protein